jgi:hypothetical protein
VDLHIDVSWLLDVQEQRMTDLAVRDYSALVAAVARHRVNTPRLEPEPDAAWRAAALLHTIVQLRITGGRGTWVGLQFESWRSACVPER